MRPDSSDDRRDQDADCDQSPAAPPGFHRVTSAHHCPNRRCLWHDIPCNSSGGLSSRCGEESSDLANELLGLLIERQVPALFEDDKLRTGNLAMDPECRRRSHVHVISPGYDQRRETEFAQLGVEIKAL